MLKSPKKKNDKIEINENVEINEEEKIQKIMKELEKIKRENYDVSKIIPEELDIDNEENGHLDFVHAVTNLRAKIFRIDECDKYKTKKIVGKIIPKIITTTSSITAIASLQLYTTFQTLDIQYFRECYFNLNSNYFNYTPPHEVKKFLDRGPDNSNHAFKAVPVGWTKWDIIEVKGSKTCGELCEYLKDKYEILVDTILIDDIIIYDTILEVKNNKAHKIEDVYVNYTRKPNFDKKRFLYIQIISIVPVAIINGREYKDVNVLFPLIKYNFSDN